MDWLAAPFAVTLLIAFAVLIGTAVLLVFLSFGPWTGRFVQSFRGVVAPFFGATTLILGILIGFLANDIWDRNRRAAAAVRSEADGLISLVELASTFNVPIDPIAEKVRSYATAVVIDEWPRMAEGESAPQAERAFDQLLRTIVRPVGTTGSNSAFDRLLIDTALTVKTNRTTRLALAEDESQPLKWVAVIVLAVLSQMSVAAVHLEKPRPQILALILFTAAMAFIIALLASHEVPFESIGGVSPYPLARVLDMVPEPKSQAASPAE